MTMNTGWRRLGLLITAFALGTGPVRTQEVMRDLPQDQGSAGTWQKIRKLQTTASAMHTTAHPDDEHGGVLTMLSRGGGARMALLTLNRGESGDNAIGSELFEGVGLIRTEELLVSDKYYGVDNQYFTTMIDYGFSKRLDEALGKWGRDNVLRDVVRVIRMDRPFVLIARFQGNPRDGHGNHEAAGLITQEAFKAAGDPKMFPEQIAQGLRPWQPLKMYMGGVRENEDWTIRVDTGQYDPVLGESYQTFARIGLSFQRSQNSGSLRAQPGPSISYYKRLQTVVNGPDKENSFFDGIDTTIPGMYRALRLQAPGGAETLLANIDREIKTAASDFDLKRPAAAAPALARALAAVRTAAQTLASEPDVVFLLRVKEAQLQDTLASALGVTFTALAQRAGSEAPTGPFAAFAAPAAMPAIVPGQAFEVVAQFTSRSDVPVTGARLALRPAQQGWTVSPASPVKDAQVNTPINHKFAVTAPATAALNRSYFSRKSINESRYAVTDQTQLHRPSAEPPLTAVATFEVANVSVEVRKPVIRLEGNLPYGNNLRVLSVVPALAVSLDPGQAIVPLGMREQKIQLRAEVTNNADARADGTLTLKVPAGWKVEPASSPIQFARAGERAFFPFTVTIPALETREYRIEAIATSGGRDYREGYAVINQRDLETRYLFRDAVATVRGIDVKIAPGLKVGYVMGVGDDVPAGIAQLGAEVTLLGAQELASADLSRFNAIMTGTRAYAVRTDLVTYNYRLLEYVKNGGNLIVLYNTQEFVPTRYAPFPGELPRGAEEVSEEDSPVNILSEADPVFTTPNKITKADFDGWVEQRGSKFWTKWDSAYTPLLATFDKGQEPQSGGWLHARHGKGHYTYFAYAFHRQLPYGVPGAYRILANLLSLGTR
ncbi:MAG: PIG-L family deacetylase [Vicinamibacterales bacterium]